MYFVIIFLICKSDAEIEYSINIYIGIFNIMYWNNITIYILLFLFNDLYITYNGPKYSYLNILALLLLGFTGKTVIKEVFN